jgi:predicted nucleic acid-binding Zn ribbon protein
MSRRRRTHTGNPGRWQVMRERARLTESRPPPADCEASPIGQTIAALMKKLGLEEQHWVGVLGEEWTSLVGDAVAKHTRPGAYKQGCLTVFVDNSVWFSELSRYGHRDMLANLQRRFGRDKVRRIRLQMDPDGGSERG